MLTTVIVTAALLGWICLWLATEPPWLGLKLKEDQQSVIVTKVFSHGPSAGKVVVGDRIIALHSPNNKTMKIKAENIIEEPDMLPTYADFNRFMLEQSELYNILLASTVILETDRGLVIIKPSERPLYSLPFVFWFQILCGFMAVLTGCSVFAFRPAQAATRCYAITGVSFLLITFSAAIYSGRELALHGDIFRILSVIDHFGAMLFSGAFISLLWFYPTQLGRLLPTVFIVAIYMLVWLLDTLQWLPSPDWGIRIPVIVGLCFSIIFAVKQWQLSYQKPLERASLKWFLFSLYIGSTTFVIAIFVTVWLGLPAPLSQGYAFGVISAMYLGVAVGITRYRLFNLERWWFQVWLWFFAGLAVIAVDLLFVYALHFTQPLALGIALALAGWLYFPARQWLFNRLMPGGKQAIESMFPQLLQIGLSATTPERLREDWKTLLQDAFKPLQIRDTDTAVSQVRLLQDGLVLDIPGLDQQASLMLSYPFGGRRLFSSDDLHLAEGLWRLAERAVGDRRRYENAIKLERDRIYRDLHDDVGAKLLSISYRSTDENNIELARSALQDLRDVVSRASCENMTLLEALADWRVETCDRLENAGIVMHWQQTNALPQHSLIPQQTMNIGRILREAVSNIIRHAKASNAIITIDIKQNSIHICIENDGSYKDIGAWKRGRGTHNMIQRAELLGGKLEWQQRQPNGTRIVWWFPLMPTNDLYQE
jgi:signal transduction histidine kinase